MKIRHKIFEQFIKKRRLRFSEIEKATGVKSNTLAYHLDNMAKEGILTKDEDEYLLTVHAERMIPFFSGKGIEVDVLPIVLAAIVQKNQILLMKRKKRPYLGYWALPGGKLKIDESIPECVVREVKEKTGLDSKFSHTASVIHSRSFEGKTYKNSVVIFLTIVKPLSTQIKESEEGKLEWFPLKNLQPARIIPSDYHMIKDHLKEITRITCVIMEEKEEKIANYAQTKI